MQKEQDQADHNTTRDFSKSLGNLHIFPSKDLSATSKVVLGCSDLGKLILGGYAKSECYTKAEGRTN